MDMVAICRQECIQQVGSRVMADSQCNAVKGKSVSDVLKCAKKQSLLLLELIKVLKLFTLNKIRYTLQNEKNPLTLLNFSPM